MSISQVGITCKKSQLINRYLFSILLKLKTAIYKNKPEIASVVGESTDADDWIIDGQSLSAYCIRMRYVEKNELDSIAQTGSVASVQAMNIKSRIRNDLLEPAVF